jgi:predicted RNA-binding protein YlqC (UPF0109 family)
MDSLKILIETMVKGIVDAEDDVQVSLEDTEKGPTFEIKVHADDVGKVIGKQGRIATAIRTVAKAAGAKRGKRIMLNVLNNKQ